MKVAAIGCIHNDIENLPNLLDKIFSYKPDIVLMVGDLTDIDFVKGFNAKDIASIFLEELRYYTQNILIVPGSWDKEIIDFWERENVLLHGKGKIIGNVGFYGFGGAKTPFNTPFEPEETEIEVGLKNAYSNIRDCKIKIQATHAPPYQTTVDIVLGKHVGSMAVRKIIEELQPNVAVCSHIHESFGKDMIGNTIVINVGKLTDGYFGFIEIEKEKIIAEIISLI